jgi:hypothetical protein
MEAGPERAKGRSDPALWGNTRDVAPRVRCRRRPQPPVVPVPAGLAYSQTGDKASARQALKLALQLIPDFDGATNARKVLATLN